MAEPLMDQYEKVSSYDVHKYQVRCTFAAGVGMSYRSRDAVPTRPTTSTVVVTLPKTYAEVVSFKCGRQTAPGAQTEWVVTTNNVAIDGTLTLTHLNNAGAAASPAVNDVAYFEIGVSSDTLNDRFFG